MPGRTVFGGFGVLIGFDAEIGQGLQVLVASPDVAVESLVPGDALCGELPVEVPVGGQV